MVNTLPDFTKITEWSKYFDFNKQDWHETESMYQEAKDFLKSHHWCTEVLESYVGMLYQGVVAVFLFKITPIKNDIDEWVWVIVGDIPPAYITLDECPNPATALDGYIGAMLEWVDAAKNGKPVDKLIPVNVIPTKENSNKLKVRLDFIDENILINHQQDLV